MNLYSTKHAYRLQAEREDTLNLMSRNDSAVVELTKERDALSLKIEDLLEQLKQKDLAQEKAILEIQEELARHQVISF